MEIDLKAAQQWYASKINKKIDELDDYDSFCAKVAYDYACEQLLIQRVSESNEIRDCHRCEYDNKIGICPRCDTDAYSR